MSTTTDPPRRHWRESPALPAWVAGALAGLAVLLTLGDPGITVDEPLDVRPGRTYVATLSKQGMNFFRRPVVDAVFRDNAEHPPLGRWLLGVASTLGQPLEVLAMGGPDPLRLYLVAGRLAPALAFAVLVGLIAHASARRYGAAAGLASGFALAVMPRVFAHAHLGALDTFISLFWVAGLLAADRALTSRRPVLAMAGAGAVWSLALLTKIQGWFLIPVVLVWSVRRLGLRKGLAASAVWGGVGFGLFVLGWPWLWFDFPGRLVAYLGTGVERATIRVLYFGTVYADRDVPWHYPWVYFLATVPVGLQLLGCLGLTRAWRARRDDAFPFLPAGSILLFLALFSTRVPVYDGERLFLMVFPLWALLIGRGFGAAWEGLRDRRWARVAALLFLLAQGYGVVAIHPFGLSYYNAGVGGLPGAERLGMELTYWGDAVDRVLLGRLVEQARPETAVALVPTLYPGQGIATTTREMARTDVLLGDEDLAGRARLVVVSRREAYWSPAFRDRLGRGKRVATRERDGVWLSAIYSLPVPRFNRGQPPPPAPRR